MSEHNQHIVATVVALLLAGCATSALKMAPEHPDRPWSPNATADGEIVPSDGGAGKTVATPDYSLPVNRALSHPSSAPELDREHNYSLAELIDIAQSTNPATRIAWNDAREAALATGIAKSTYLPHLTASVVGGRQDVHNSNSTLGSSDTKVDGVVSALSIQWLLFDFGERSAVVNAARQASIVANIGFTAAHQHVVHAVSLAYYAQAAAQARVGTAERTLKNAEAVQTAAEERRAHGIGTVVEVAQARQLTAQAQLLQVQARGAAQDSYLALLTAMGISPLTRIRIADIPQRVLPDSDSEPIEHIIAEALGRRPDVLAAYAAQEASLDNVRAARAEFLPKVFFSATGAYNNGHLDLSSLPALGPSSPSTVNLTDNRFGVTVFAGITVPLYDGGLRAAVLEQARAKADNAAITLTHTKDEAVRQIVVAQNGLRTALSAQHASVSLASAADTTYQASFAAYQNGVGSITDVIVAESQLLQAQNMASDTYSEALAAAATLALAVGRLGSTP